MSQKEENRAIFVASDARPVILELLVQSADFAVIIGTW